MENERHGPTQDAGGDKPGADPGDVDQQDAGPENTGPENTGPENTGPEEQDAGGNKPVDPSDVDQQDAGPAPGAKPKRERPLPRGRLRSVADYDKEIARSQRLRSRARARERRKERDRRLAEKKQRDRRLIILAGSLLAAGNRGDADARRLVTWTLEHLRPGDREPFEGWKPDWESDDGD